MVFVGSVEEHPTWHLYPVIGQGVCSAFAHTFLWHIVKQNINRLYTDEAIRYLSCSRAYAGRERLYRCTYHVFVRKTQV